MNMNKLFSKLISPLPSKEKGGANAYGPELLGTLSAGPSGLSSPISEEVILDKCNKSDAYTKANEAKTYLFNQIQELKTELDKTRDSVKHESISSMLVNACEAYNEAQIRAEFIQRFVAFMENEISTDEVRSYIFDNVPEVREAVERLDDFNKLLMEGTDEDVKTEGFVSIYEDANFIEKTLNEKRENIPYNNLSTVLESTIKNETCEDLMEYSYHTIMNRLDNAIYLLERAYQLLNKSNDVEKSEQIAIHESICKYHDLMHTMVCEQAEDRVKCMKYLERTNGDLYNSFLVNDYTMLYTLERLKDICDKMNIRNIHLLTENDISYIRENALTVKLNTFAQMIATKRNPIDGEKMRDTEWAKTWKQYCKLNNEHADLINDRERLYHKQHKKSTDEVARKIDTINGRIGAIVKQIHDLDDKLVKIELSFIERGCMSKGYWIGQIERTEAGIKRLNEMIDNNEKRISFIKKLLSEEGTQNNPQVKQSLETELASTRNDVEFMEKTIQKHKQTIAKYKEALKSAPNKHIKDGKVVFESKNYTMQSLPNVLYFASKEKKEKLSGKKLFLTPYKGIASLFIASEYMNESLRKWVKNKTGKSRPRISCNISYDEWSYDNYKVNRPLSVIHANHNIPEITDTISGTASGYIHSVDVSKVKDKLKVFSTNDPNREVVYSGEDLVPVDVIQHNVKWELKFSKENMEHSFKGTYESSDIDDVVLEYGGEIASLLHKRVFAKHSELKKDKQYKSLYNKMIRLNADLLKLDSKYIEASSDKIKEKIDDVISKKEFELMKILKQMKSIEESYDITLPDWHFSDNNEVVFDESVGSRLDKIVDNINNRQLRADDEFRELDDKLWKAKQELTELNKKAAKINETGIFKVSERLTEIEEKINSQEREIDKLQKKWEDRLEHIAEYLPRSYWTKLWSRYQNEFEYSSDMAEAFADEVKDTQKTLDDINSGILEGSAALARANIRFYKEREDFYKDAAKEAKRLQKDCERRIDALPIEK